MRYVDPDGRYFNEANEQIAQTIHGTAMKKAHEAQGNNDRMRELISTALDIIDMRYDPDHEYWFKSAINGDYETKCEGTNARRHQIIAMYSEISSLDGTTAHEARHGGQVARGEMSYDNMGNPQNYGVMKEVDAYKAQWGWDGNLSCVLLDYSNVNSNITTPLPPMRNFGYKDINESFVNSIMRKINGKYVKAYPPAGLNIELWGNH